MGFAKRQEEEALGRGWRSPGAKYVCESCLDDAFLRQVARVNRSHSECSYCGRRGRRNLSTKVDVIFDIVGRTIKEHFADAVDELPYDNEDRSYSGETYDVDDMLEEIGSPFSIDSLDSEFLESFGDNHWCDKNPFQLKRDEALVAGWYGFGSSYRARTTEPSSGRSSSGS
ncbi:MAG: HEPN-associated N-terminal domain-containing protein [Dehalococcoidia bacterium]